MRESAIDKQILGYINSLPNGRAVKLVALGQGRGEPDIIATINGRSAFLETKTPIGKLTAIQRHVLSEWRKAGAVAIVATSLDDAKRQLQEIL